MSIAVITERHSWMGQNGARSADELTLRETNFQCNRDMNQNSETLKELEQRLEIIMRELNMTPEQRQEPEYQRIKSNHKGKTVAIEDNKKPSSKKKGAKKSVS